MAGHPQHHHRLHYSSTAAAHVVPFEFTTSSKGGPWIYFFDRHLVSVTYPREKNTEANSEESVIVICIVRITYIMSLQNNPDVTYSQGRAAVWS
jgi:hypothetical protein